MKSNMKNAGKMPNDRNTGKGSNDYNNEISTGSIGLEGGGNNGAPELRSLRKKCGSTNNRK